MVSHNQAHSFSKIYSKRNLALILIVTCVLLLFSQKFQTLPSFLVALRASNPPSLISKCTIPLQYPVRMVELKSFGAWNQEPKVGLNLGRSGGNQFHCDKKKLAGVHFCDYLIANTVKTVMKLMENQNFLECFQSDILQVKYNHSADVEKHLAVLKMTACAEHQPTFPDKITLMSSNPALSQDKFEKHFGFFRRLVNKSHLASESCRGTDLTWSMNCQSNEYQCRKSDSLQIGDGTTQFNWEFNIHWVHTPNHEQGPMGSTKFLESIEQHLVGHHRAHHASCMVFSNLT